MSYHHRFYGEDVINLSTMRDVMKPKSQTRSTSLAHTPPKDLVLMRHFESVGNQAWRQYFENGQDESAFTGAFREGHASEWRLSEHGVSEALYSRDWLEREGLFIPDQYIVSPLVRARESAMLLDLPGASWEVESLLRERDDGYIDTIPPSQHKQYYSHEMDRRNASRYYWQTPGGESVSDVALRVELLLNKWMHQYSESRVLAVTHGAVIRAFISQFTGELPEEYNEQHTAGRIGNEIHNGQLVQFTRTNPWTGVMYEQYVAMRSVCPWDTSRSTNEWLPITPRRFSNEDLFGQVTQFP